MNTKIDLLFVFAIAFLTGCAGGPPTKLEQKLFSVQTNVVATPATQTNVVTVTNLVRQVVTETNQVHQLVLETNLVPQVVTFTNLVPAFVTVTNYQYAPNATVQTGTSILGAVPGYGGLAAAVLGGIFGLWGTLRSSNANKTSATLAQCIEVARNLIATQQGQQVADKFKSWLMEHQQDMGVINSVAALVDNAVDPAAAKTVAAQLLKLSA